MNVQKITSPDGREMVMLSAEDFEDLIDARDHAIAMAAYQRGDDEGLTGEEMLEYVNTPSPITFWRKKRGLTQIQLADTIGISQAYLAQIETGKRTGDIEVHSKLARTLKLRIEDLLTDKA